MRKGNYNEVECSLSSFEYSGNINARWEKEREKCGSLEFDHGRRSMYYFRKFLFEIKNSIISLKLTRNLLSQLRFALNSRII